MRSLGQQATVNHNLNDHDSTKSAAAVPVARKRKLKLDSDVEVIIPSKRARAVRDGEIEAVRNLNLVKRGQLPATNPPPATRSTTAVQDSSRTGRLRQPASQKRLPGKRRSTDKVFSPDSSESEHPANVVTRSATTFSKRALSDEQGRSKLARPRSSNVPRKTAPSHRSAPAEADDHRRNADPTEASANEDEAPRIATPDAEVDEPRDRGEKTGPSLKPSGVSAPVRQPLAELHEHPNETQTITNEVGAQEMDTHAHSTNLYGLNEHFEALFANLKKVGQGAQIPDVATKASRKIETQCLDIRRAIKRSTARASLPHSADQTEQGASDSPSTAQKLQEVYDTARHLTEALTQRAISRSIQDIYAHVIPDLVRVLQTLIKSFGQVDGLSDDGFRLITSLVEQTLNLYTWAYDRRKANKQDDLEGANVLLAVSQMKQHLQLIHRGLSQELRRVQYLEQRIHRQHAEQEQRRLQALEWERTRHVRERQALVRQAVADRDAHWTALHDLRYRIELLGRSFIRPQIARRFRKPMLQDYEVNTDGELVEWKLGSRGKIIHTVAVVSEERIPTPWSDEADEQLFAGLEACAGPKLYEKIIATRCRPVWTDSATNEECFGLLAPYTVTDIVDRALSLRAMTLDYYSSEDSEIARWITDIYDPRLVVMPIEVEEEQEEREEEEEEVANEDSDDIDLTSQEQQENVPPQDEEVGEDANGDQVLIHVEEASDDAHAERIDEEELVGGQEFLPTEAERHEGADSEHIAHRQVDATAANVGERRSGEGRPTSDISAIGEKTPVDIPGTGLDDGEVEDNPVEKDLPNESADKDADEPRIDQAANVDDDDDDEEEVVQDGVTEAIQVILKPL